MPKKDSLGAGKIAAIGGGVFAAMFVIFILLSSAGGSLPGLNLFEPKLKVSCQAKIQNPIGKASFNSVSCIPVVSKTLLIAEGKPLFIIPLIPAIITAGAGLVGFAATATDEGVLVLEAGGQRVEEAWECDDPNFLTDPFGKIVCDLGTIETPKMPAVSTSYKLTLLDDSGKVIDSREGTVNV